MVWTWRSYRKYATRQDYRGTKERGLIEFFSDIPGLRDDPKIVGRDDTKVVGDSSSVKNSVSGRFELSG
jgi:hypothetical protein